MTILKTSLRTADKLATDITGHGTFVAGIVVDSTPNLSVMIMPVKVLSSNENSSSMLDVARGIRWALENGADVINMSLSSRNMRHEYTEYWVRQAVAQNVPVVVAAGNQRQNTGNRSPAAEPSAITVAAVDDNNRPARERTWGTNFGYGIVDIAAPGVRINSSTNGGGFATESGTSAATPHVSAAVAMYMMYRPWGMTPAEIESALKNYVYIPLGWNPRYGAGVLDMNRVQPLQSPQEQVIHITYWCSLGERGTLTGDRTNIGYTEIPNGVMWSITDTAILNSDYELRSIAMPDNSNYIFEGWVLEGSASVIIESFSCVVEHAGDSGEIRLQPLWTRILNYQIQFMMNDGVFFEDGSPNRRTATWEANFITGTNAADVIVTEDAIFYSNGQPNPNSVWWTHNRQSPENGGTPVWLLAGWTAHVQQGPGTGDINEHQILQPNMSFQQLMDMRHDPNNQFLIRLFDDPSRPGYTWRIYVHAFWVAP